MQVYSNGCLSEDIVPCGTAVALGRFDALHLGHIEIIKKVVEYAKENELKSLVFMFSNNPIEVISGKKIPSVNTMKKRMDILESLGTDIVVAQEFDAEIMDMSCEEFADVYLKNKLNARLVAAGFNYRFGKGGIGDINLLNELCKQRGINVCAVPEITVNGEKVSSTVIRNKISEGDVADAAKLMGRNYSIDGCVIHGNGIGGKLLGFPTANIELPDECAVPKFGVYVSRTNIDGNRYPSITNIGGKPTVGDDKPCVETHISGDFGDLYGKNIEVELCEFIRGISKFESHDRLVNQLEKDKIKMKKYFEDFEDFEDKERMR